MPMRVCSLVVLLGMAIALTACGSDDEVVIDQALLDYEAQRIEQSLAETREQVANEGLPRPPVEYGHRFPEVVAVEAAAQGDGRWRFDVTLSSTYDTPQRYADAWRVLDENDGELGIRVLLHDHANEQPFTRSETIDIPAGSTVVYVEGRDQANGWSGQRFEFSLPSP